MALQLIRALDSSYLKTFPGHNNFHRLNLYRIVPTHYSSLSQWYFDADNIVSVFPMHLPQYRIYDSKQHQISNQLTNLAYLSLSLVLLWWIQFDLRSLNLFFVSTQVIYLKVKVESTMPYLPPLWRSLCLFTIRYSLYLSTGGHYTSSNTQGGTRVKISCSTMAVLKYLANESMTKECNQLIEFSFLL